MPVAVKIESVGLEKVIKKYEQYPGKIQRAFNKLIWGSLLIFWESVPAYPEKLDSATYVRTGTLGRSFGASEKGGKTGRRPDIYTVEAFGMKSFRGSFGSSLEYAPHVVGEGTQARHIKKRGWWTILDIAKRSRRRLTDLWISFFRKALSE